MTAPLTALVVDDEDLARRLVREFLAPHADVAVVGECDNGLDAVRQIGALSPDLVFLDIQMPRLTGLEVLELTGRRAGVVFTTAYDEHAMKAFDLQAVDYLLKPFSRQRFDEALARARALLGRARPELDALLAAARGDRPLERLLVKDRDQVHVVAVADIDCIEAQGDYLAIHAGAQCLLKLQPLAELEAQLDARSFVRVHRSWIVNLAALQSIERHGADGHAARLRGGRRVPISRAGYERLKAWV